MAIVLCSFFLFHAVAGTEISRSVIGNGGDGATSKHYALTAALGEGLVGRSSSAHHEISWGFFAFVGQPCATVAVCDDADACTFNRCVSTICDFAPVRFGDVNGSAASGGSALPDLDDILCVIAGFGNFDVCPNADLAPTVGPGACQGDGVINLDDLLAVLAAFSGDDPCGCAG